MRKALALVVLALGLALAGGARAAVYYPSHFRLSNGLEVVVVPNRLAPVVSQMVWYKVGAVDEPPGKTGLAHYLEHLMFRGTETVPAGEFSKIIAAQGGEDNAFTSYHYTAYYEKVAADRLPMIMQMEADRMKNLRITKETADPELRVIIEERQQRTDNSPQGRFNEKFRSKLAPRHPLGRPVIGWKKDLERLTVTDVRKFYETHYVPNNTVVVISGDVKVEEVMSLAAATYGRIPKKEVPVRKTLAPLPTPQLAEFVYKDARVEQPEVAWRFSAPSYATQADNAAYAHEVLAEALAGGEVGELYKKLVTELGVASAIDTNYDPDARGETYFTVTASLRPDKSHAELKNALRSALLELSEKGIDANAVDAAKRRLQRAAVFAREGLTMPGYSFGMAMTTGNTVADVEAWPDRINEVTVEQVNAALRELVGSKRQMMGSLLPETHSKKRNAKAASRKGGRVP
jgi:zinc protease